MNKGNIFHMLAFKYLMWRELRQIRWVGAWSKRRGLTMCRIVDVAGSDYIVASDGSYRKVGKAERRTPGSNLIFLPQK